MRISHILVVLGLAVSAAVTHGAAPVQLKEMTIELGGGVKMEFVLVPAGSFVMGSDKYGSDERPAHRVRISKPFYIGRHEVTQEQWEIIMGGNPSEFMLAKNPVNGVNWGDCQRFMAALKDKVRGQTFRLPTEAEWEYACQAGSKTDYCYGDATDKLGDYAWFKDNSGGKVHPVGQKKPNAWGLFDMHGNVKEWCQDPYHSNYNDAPTNGKAWLLNGESHRIARGGAYYHYATAARSAVRYHYNPGIKESGIGLRLVVVFDGKALSAPTIHDVIRDKAGITGNFAAVEVVEAIANALNVPKAR